MAAPDDHDDQTIPLDPNRIALLADTHIDTDPKRFVYGTKWPGSPVKEDEHEGVNMAECLEHVANDVLAQNPRPAHAIVNGDCARTNGREGEYREFLRLIKPIRNAGITVHVTIGNHDNREQLWKAAPDLKVEDGGRHVGVVALPKAEIALLDSETGTLGAEQLKWLREQLVDSKRHDLPMLGFVHYNPYPRPGVRPLKGLNSKESDSLLALVSEQKRAKALFFGHTHDWAVEKWINVHMINQPPVGYYFGKGKPHGWIDMNLTDAGAVLQMRCIDPEHPKHGERHQLQWRS
ncbi:MAG: Icc protein [Verrucomicrobiales bacterium]|jgi:Icc protein